MTFGTPIATSEYDAQSKRDVLELAHRTREAIGLLFKVTPTALVAAALKPSMGRRDLEDRIDGMLDELRRRGANLAVDSGRQAVDEAIGPFEKRGVIVVEQDRFRVRNRLVLRYYGRMLDHLFAPPRSERHRPEAAIEQD